MSQQSVRKSPKSNNTSTITTDLEFNTSLLRPRQSSKPSKTSEAEALSSWASPTHTTTSWERTSPTWTSKYHKTSTSSKRTRSSSTTTTRVTFFKSSPSPLKTDQLSSSKSSKEETTSVLVQETSRACSSQSRKNKIKEEISQTYDLYSHSFIYQKKKKKK